MAYAAHPLKVHCVCVFFWRGGGGCLLRCRGARKDITQPTRGGGYANTKSKGIKQEKTSVFVFCARLTCVDCVVFSPCLHFLDLSAVLGETKDCDMRTAQPCANHRLHCGLCGVFSLSALSAPVCWKNLNDCDMLIVQTCTVSCLHSLCLSAGGSISLLHHCRGPRCLWRPPNKRGCGQTTTTMQTSP